MFVVLWPTYCSCYCVQRLISKNLPVLDSCYPFFNGECSFKVQKHKIMHIDVFSAVHTSCLFSFVPLHDLVKNILQCYHEFVSK